MIATNSKHSEMKPDAPASLIEIGEAAPSSARSWHRMPKRDDRLSYSFDVNRFIANYGSCLTVTAVPGDQLSSDHIAAWSELQTNDPHVDSPFFRPEFTQAVASVRDDVEVAVLRQAGEYIGFLPYQRSAGGGARPVGGRRSDFQGIVLKPGTQFDPMQLIRDCGLSAWHFDHLLAEQQPFVPHHWTLDCSPYIDVSKGYDAYLADRRTQNAAEVLQSVKKKRKTENQLGKVRFVPHTTDRSVLKQLIEWKTQQYNRCQTTSPFQFPWVVALVERLLDGDNTAEFGPILSALYAGDRLIAAHLGMRSKHVAHWWYPAYDTELSKYSPGSQLLLELASAAKSMGVSRIDLGKGPESYKRSFMTGAIALAEGSIDSRPLSRTVRQLWHYTHRVVRDSPLRTPMTTPWRVIKRVRDQIQNR